MSQYVTPSSQSAAALIVAAGSSRRMAGRDKLWLPLSGRLTLARTVEVFENSSAIDQIILVLNAERLQDAEELVAREHWHKVRSLIVGGARRQDSVCRGLDALAHQDAPPRWVLIHDGARPFVNATMIEAGLQAAQQHGAAIAAVAVKDTIKEVADNLVQATLDRSRLWAVQTPQVFALALIHQAHHSVAGEAEATDDAALLERLGRPVAIFPGHYHNLKITTQEDLLLAEFLLQQGQLS